MAILRTDMYALSKTAAKSGDLQWFIKHCSSKSKNLEAPIANGNQLFSDAVGNNQLELVKWFISESNFNIQIRTNDFHVLYLAAENGYFELLKWLIIESGQKADVTGNDNEVFRIAAQNGHFEIMRWLVEESDQDIDVTACNYDVLWTAAIYGYLDILKWLIKDVPHEFRLETENWAVMRAATNYGQVEFFTWIIDESWKYTGQLVPLTLAEVAFEPSTELLERMCPKYYALQALKVLGYSDEDAIAESLKLITHPQLNLSALRV